MGKTRAEIQRKYREKKKATDPEFLNKERLRVRNYYVPAETLNKKKLAERNKKAMLRNRLSRLKKKQQLTAQDEEENQNVSDSGYASLEAIPSTSSAPPERIPLVVKLPSIQSSAKSKGVTKVRTHALARQRKLNEALSREVKGLRRRIKIKNTKINRLERKIKADKIPNDKLTPRKQTEHDISPLSLTPNRRRSVRKKLLLGNTLLGNIDAAKQNITTKKRNILHQIIGGKVVKKNRLALAINKATGIDRKRLSKVHGKFSFYHHEFRNSITKRVETKVVQFLEREDNSRVQPGKADMKKSGTAEKKQTLVLTDYLYNLHLKFQAENQEIHMSLASFCRMRPKYILLASFISRNACQCIRHQNMAMKLRALRKVGIQISENPENALKQKETLNSLLDAIPGNVVYSEWKRVTVENKIQKMKIVESERSKQEFIELFEREFFEFSQHVNRVREQYKALRELKEGLKKDEMILQMDFAENYSCRSLDKVQTAYWNQTSVTLHPVVVYYRRNEALLHRSFVIVSDDTNHSSATVCTFVDSLIPQLKEINPNLKLLHYWTDSPSSQYRNKYIFHTVANHAELYGMPAVWNYFEAGHGKGPCDGLGGTTKRMADEAIRQGNAVIQDARDFFKWGKGSSMTGVTFLFVEKAACEKKREHLNDQSIKPVKNTMKLHATAGSTGDSQFRTRETSCYCDACLNGFYCSNWSVVTVKCPTKDKVPYEVVEHVTDAPCEQTTFHSQEKQNSKHGEVQQNTTPEQQQSQASNVQQSQASNVQQNLESKLQPIPSLQQNTTHTLQQNIQEDLLEKPDTQLTLTNGDYIAAVYDNIWYIGVVIDEDEMDNEYHVKFMKKSRNLYKWPNPPDLIWIKQSDILCKINDLCHQERVNDFINLERMMKI